MDFVCCTSAGLCIFGKMERAGQVSGRSLVCWVTCLYLQPSSMAWRRNVDSPGESKSAQSRQICWHSVPPQVLMESPLPVCLCLCAVCAHADKVRADEVPHQLLCADCKAPMRPGC